MSELDNLWRSAKLQRCKWHRGHAHRRTPWHRSTKALPRVSKHAARLPTHVPFSEGIQALALEVAGLISVRQLVYICQLPTDRTEEEVRTGEGETVVGAA
jgi:hypothetical protein